MKIDAKTYSQFLFNVLGFTKEEIRKIVVSEIQTETKKIVHRIVQKNMPNPKEYVSEHVKRLLRDWDFDRRVRADAAEILVRKLKISIFEK